MPKKSDPKRTLVQISDYEKNYAMSRALVQGDWCFISGTVGNNYKTGELPDSAAQQTLNAFTNIGTALKAAGFELGHTVRVQYTVKDRADIDKILPVIQKFFGQIRPAATMVIGEMVDPKMKIEVEVTAYKG